MLMSCSGYLPFRSSDREALIAETNKAQLTFPDRYWSKTSAVAREFILSVVKPDPKDRPTARQALQHPVRERTSWSVADRAVADDAPRRLERRLVRWPARELEPTSTLASRICRHRRDEPLQGEVGIDDTNAREQQRHGRRRLRHARGGACLARLAQSTGARQRRTTGHGRNRTRCDQAQGLSVVPLSFIALDPCTVSSLASSVPWPHAAQTHRILRRARARAGKVPKSCYPTRARHAAVCPPLDRSPLARTGPRALRTGFATMAEPPPKRARTEESAPPPPALMALPTDAPTKLDDAQATRIKHFVRCVLRPRLGATAR